MIATNTYLFHSGRSAYVRTCLLGWLLCIGFLACAWTTVAFSVKLWATYAHSFAPYLKWQDALLALLCFVAFLALGGCAFAVRFLFGVHAGYTKGMILLESNTLHVRDLSPVNFASIFWIMTAIFCCFVAILIGLLPAMLMGWTLYLPSPLLAFFVTSIAVVLGIAGMVVSLIAASCIVFGCVGLIPFYRSLGARHTYTLNNNHTMLSIDDGVLTITYPGLAESMVDLNLLAKDDQLHLLFLLRTRWMSDTSNPESIEPAMVAV